MISLFLSTFSKYLNIALFEEKRLIKEIYVELGKDLSTKSLVYIDELLKDCKKEPNEIDRIYCVVGPGSFTGVRIGVTIAKTYAYALKKEVYPVSSLFVMATSLKEEGFIIPMIDARRGYVFAGIYNENYQTILEEQYISLDKLQEIVNKLNKKVFYVSDDTFENIEVIKYKPNLENFILHSKAEKVEPHWLVPNYLKKPEAEENLNI